MRTDINNSHNIFHIQAHSVRLLAARNSLTLRVISFPSYVPLFLVSLPAFAWYSTAHVKQIYLMAFTLNIYTQSDSCLTIHNHTHSNSCTVVPSNSTKQSGRSQNTVRHPQSRSQS